MYATNAAVFSKVYVAVWTIGRVCESYAKAFGSPPWTEVVYGGRVSFGADMVAAG
jgi:hypothetical protein